jgi:hypothetical protein
VEKGYAVGVWQNKTKLVLFESVRSDGWQKKEEKPPNQRE